VRMLVDNANFTFPAFPVLSGHRNEFRGAEACYFSRILTCARLTFFPSFCVLCSMVLVLVQFSNFPIFQFPKTLNVKTLKTVIRD
jgi:hypothetical protein